MGALLYQTLRESIVDASAVRFLTMRSSPDSVLWSWSWRKNFIQAGDRSARHSDSWKMKESSCIPEM